MKKLVRFLVILLIGTAQAQELYPDNFCEWTGYHLWLRDTLALRAGTFKCGSWFIDNWDSSWNGTLTVGYWWRVGDSIHLTQTYCIGGYYTIFDVPPEYQAHFGDGQIRVDGIFLAHYGDPLNTYWYKAVQSPPLPLRWDGPPVATFADGKIKVSWGTISEINTYMFYLVGRARIDSIKAAGTSLSPHKYSLYDLGYVAGVNKYRIVEVDLDGQTFYSDTVSITINLTVEETKPLPKSGCLGFGLADGISALIPLSMLILLKKRNDNLL